MKAFPYVRDYHSTLLEREAKRLFLFPWQGQSPQLGTRRQLIDVVANIAEEFRLHCTTVHLAVFLVDVFMDRHVITECHLQLLSATCLFTASKYEEEDACTPRLKDLMGELKLGLPKQYFHCMELVLLKAIDWELGFPTVASFLELYLQRTGLVSVDALPLRLRAMDFANVSLEYPEFNLYKPSLVAAACMAAACHMFDVLPAWNDDLTTCTGYTPADTEKCAETLMSCFQYKDKLSYA